MNNTTYTDIVRDSSGYFYAVRDAGPELAHAFWGTPVKKVKGGFAPKAGQPERLIRRAGTARVQTVGAQRA